MIFKLLGQFQHYDWGGEVFIPNYLGLDDTVRKKQPYAEYWLGSHPAAPSKILFENQWVDLDKVLETVPQLLSEQTIQKFGKALPYLLKILDVKLPLSIQLHPTKAEAEIGFAMENKQNIPLDSPQRTFKDANHKPEMMIALSDFWLLHGFQTTEKIVANLAKHHSLWPLKQLLETQSLVNTYEYIMRATQSQLQDWLWPIIQQKQSDYAQKKLSFNDPDYWVLYCIDKMAIALDKLDPGLLSFYLFNIVHLKQGEGIYQEAGLPHAYLRGQNIELMAASDNVIRGGLTSKYVDIDNLLNIINYTEVVPQIIPVCQQNENPYLYPTPAEDFALQNFVFNAGKNYSFIATTASIFLMLSGTTSVQCEDCTISLKQGEAIFIASGSMLDIFCQHSGRAVIATLPR